MVSGKITFQGRLALVPHISLSSMRKMEIAALWGEAIRRSRRCASRLVFFPVHNSWPKQNAFDVTWATSQHARLSESHVDNKHVVVPVTFKDVRSEGRSEPATDLQTTLRGEPPSKARRIHRSRRRQKHDTTAVAAPKKRRFQTDVCTRAM